MSVKHSLLYDACAEREGLDGFVYCARRPFHPTRFCRLISADWPGVTRLKGFVWLAECPDTVGLWQWAEGVCTVAPAGRWWAARPDSEWPAAQAVRAEIRRGWHEGHGDRRQEVVFIGAALDRAALTATLDAALVTEQEMNWDWSRQ